jgi:predicted HTH transcriptional regulator
LILFKQERTAGINEEGYIAADQYKDIKNIDTVNDTVNRFDLILKEIEKNPKVIYEELSGLLNVSRITIIREMGKMKKLGLIERVGSDKRGYWKVLKSPHFV